LFRQATTVIKFANRHGLITGATGTGKTISLQILAEGFADAGVPVFAADIKGDLSGIAEPGIRKDNLRTRANEIGLTNWSNTAYPTVFWDLFGEAGHPVRATVGSMGPLLLARLLELNETQEGVPPICYGHGCTTADLSQKLAAPHSITSSLSYCSETRTP
jgi:DNA helicase HerA-like ATPase